VLGAAKALGFDGGLVRSEGREGNATALLRRPRFRLVGHDPKDPGLERGAALEAGAAVEHGDPCLLDDLLGDRAALHVQLREPEHCAAVAADERREGDFVAGPECVDESKLIGEHLAHNSAIRQPERTHDLRNVAQRKRAAMPTTTSPSGSAERWGPLWGARPEYWAANEEQQIPTYEEATRRVDVAAGQRVLELGCGSGVFLRLAAERGATVYGLDASEALVEIARSRVPNADVRVGDMQFLPYEDDLFDFVAGFNSFFFAADMGADLPALI
jgi:Methyltransferase domain